MSFRKEFWNFLKFIPIVIGWIALLCGILGTLFYAFYLAGPKLMLLIMRILFGLIVLLALWGGAQAYFAEKEKDKSDSS